MSSDKRAAWKWASVGVRPRFEPVIAERLQNIQPRISLLSSDARPERIGERILHRPGGSGVGERTDNGGEICREALPCLIVLDLNLTLPSALPYLGHLHSPFALPLRKHSPMSGATTHASPSRLWLVDADSSPLTPPSSSRISRRLPSTSDVKRPEMRDTSADYEMHLCISRISRPDIALYPECEMADRAGRGRQQLTS